MDLRERRLKALGDYLKSRRARLSPSDAGLPHGHTRRRTPGLRREEVAQLAGVSATWYAWLEQGRDINVSDEILDCIGSALLLSRDEYAHMMNLAHLPAQSSADKGDTGVPAGLRLIIEGLAYPAMAVNERADVLAWNDPACDVFADFAAVPAQERNMLWQWFANESLRARIANWEERSPYAVALFRSFCDLHAGDPWYPTFAARLMEVSSYFKELWHRGEIRQKSGGTLEFRGPGSGTQPYEVTSFPNVNGNGAIHFFVFTPCGKPNV